jgi:proteasome lid subunit RPN8/RPN11
MKLEIAEKLMEQIHTHGERAYPEEGAGLLLGKYNGDTRVVKAILALTNAREDADRHNRYLITAEDMMTGEREAMRLGLDIVGVFHSHPDHPNRPSEFDREWAMPWFSYIITSVNKGKAVGSRSWRLADDRDDFAEEFISFTGIS